METTESEYSTNEEREDELTFNDDNSTNSVIDVGKECSDVFLTIRIVRFLFSLFLTRVDSPALF